MEQFLTKNNRTSNLVPFLFAEDLVSHVMKFLGVKWKPSLSYQSLRDRVDTAFCSEIGRAIYLFPTYFNKELNAINHQLTESFKSYPHTFSMFMNYLEDQIFSSDLFLEFIVFCGCVIYVAENLCREGYPEFLDEVMVGIPFAFFHKLEPEFEFLGGWQSFKLYCSEFVSSRSEVVRSEVYLHQYTEAEKKREFMKNFPKKSILALHP